MRALNKAEVCWGNFSGPARVARSPRHHPVRGLSLFAGTISVAPPPHLPYHCLSPRDSSKTHWGTRNNLRHPEPPAKALPWGAGLLRPAAPLALLSLSTATPHPKERHPIHAPLPQENPKIAPSRPPSLWLPRQLHHHPGSRRLATPRLKILHPAPHQGRRTPKPGGNRPKTSSEAQK